MPMVKGGSNFVDFGSILHAQMVPGLSRGSRKEPREPRDRARGRPDSSGRSPRRVPGAPQGSPGTLPGSFLDLLWDNFRARKENR